MRRLLFLPVALFTCVVTEAHAFWWLLRGAAQLAQTEPLVPNAFPFTMLSALGFSQADQLLFILCPLVAVLGSLVRLSLRALSWSEKRARPTKTSLEPNQARRQMNRTLVSVVATIFIAFVAGLVVALYFAGSIAPSREAVGKLLAFTLLIGFVAPTFFNAQERRLAHYINGQRGSTGEG